MGHGGAIHIGKSLRFIWPATPLAAAEKEGLRRDGQTVSLCVSCDAAMSGDAFN